MYSKIKSVLPSDHLVGKVSLFLSVMAMFFAVSSGSGCLYAEECSVGDSESFSNNIRVYSNSTNYHEITGDSTNPNTSDHTLILPNKNGTLLSTAMNFGNNQYIQTNAQGNIISDDLPALDIDDDLKIDVTGILTGKYLQTTATGLTFVDVDINETTFDSSNGTEGQILQITGGNLGFVDISGGGGSFQANASQNIIPGPVGIESNGSVRNIVALQESVSALNVSHTPHTSNNDAINSWALHSFYNSNIDGLVVVYHDADTPAGCDTGMFVDVVIENSSTLSKWGRQCLSNEWGNHSNVSQPSVPSHGSRDVIRARRYGNEWDTSINDYVAVYYGGSQQSQQFYTIPFSVNPSNNTLIVGQEDLIHDEQYCYNDQSCGTQDFNKDIYQFNDMAYNTVIGHMMMFWSTYHGNYQNGYMSNRAFTCTIPITSSSGCASETSYKNTSYIAGSFTQYAMIFSPQIWYDHDAQNYLIYHNYLSNNNDCRLSSFRVSSSTSWDINHGNTLDVISTSNSGVYTEIGGMSSQNGNTYGFSCGLSAINGDVAYDSVNGVWVVPSLKDSSYQSGYDKNTDLLFIESSNSQNAMPVLLGRVDLQNRVAVANGEINGTGLCNNLAKEKCSSAPLLKQGNWHYDTSTNTFQLFMTSMVDDLECPLDTYLNTCMSIYEFSMDNVNNVIDISTFKHYKYQSPQKQYRNSIWENNSQLWKDAQGTLFAISFYNNTASGTETMSHAEAFSIPDNIDTYIGYVTQGANQNATVTVYSVGAVIDGFTGLTIGAEYFVDTAGNISTNGTHKIGRAIGTDKIYITTAR